MRVDLGLQKLKLHVPEMDLLLPVVFHQLTDPRSHAVEPVRQCADLRTARDLSPGIQVSGADLVRSLDQSRNRVGDAAGDEGGDPQRQDQEKGRGHDGRGCQQLPAGIHLLPDVFQTHRLIVKVLCDAVLDHIRDDPDIHVQPLHVFIVMPDLLYCLADIIHPLMKCDQQLEGTGEACFCLCGFRIGAYFLEGLLRSADHDVRIVHSELILHLVFAERMGNHHVHDAVHIFLEHDIEGIHLGDIPDNGAVGITDPVHAEHQIEHERRERDDHQYTETQQPYSERQTPEYTAVTVFCSHRLLCLSSGILWGILPGYV